MKFELTPEQRAFEAGLVDLLESTEGWAARSWATGDTAPGLALWKRLSEQGVNALVVPEEAGGLGGSPVDLVVAFEVLGEHAVPGPWVESAAYLPVLLADAAPDVVASLAEGAVGTVRVVEHAPAALDADVAEHAYVVDGATVHTAAVGDPRRSVDPARRLFEVAPEERVEVPETACQPAFDLAALACSAQLLGLGEQLLGNTVEYLDQRKQFGRQIGSYQALKHKAADVRIALDFVRPLVHGAALSIGTPHASRDVSAAKVAASDAAYLAARTALQLHGAIGYTEEHSLSVWLLKVRALVSAWGTTSYHRGRILDALTQEG